MLRLAALALLLGRGAATWHPLRRNEQPVKSFDRSVLGNLRNAGEVADPRLSRSHMFVAEITVGTPPQTLNCLLDSGSADLWVPSMRCKSCRTRHHFHADASSTFMPAIAHTDHGDMPVPVEVDDNSGRIVGFIVQDRVSLGPWVFHNQTFLIVEESHLPIHRTWDGICGLGWKGMSSAVEPLYRNLQRNHGYATFALVPSSPGQTYLVVGEVPHQFVHTVAWAEAEPVGHDRERSFWVASGSVGANSEAPLHTRFLIDTGTSFLLAPRKHYTRFLRSLFPRHLFDHLCGADPAADNLVVCDCAIMEGEVAHHELVVYLGGRKFGLPIPKLFKRVPTTDGGELCLLHVQQNSMTSVNPLDLLNALLGGGLGLVPGDSSGGPAGAKGARSANGTKGQAAPPFLLPPFLMPQGGKNGPPLPTDAEQVEEVTETRPDGAVCTTTLVWVGGHLKKNTTACRDQRRLQLALPGTPGDEMGEMWVLGGAFLEHFVTVLDFENHRLGFGEFIQGPTAKAHPTEQPTPAAVVRDARVPRAQRPFSSATAAAMDTEKQGGGFPWGPFLFGMFLIVPIGMAWVLARKMRTRRDLSAPLDQQGERDAELWEDAHADAAVAE